MINKGDVHSLRNTFYIKHHTKKDCDSNPDFSAGLRWPRRLYANRKATTQTKKVAKEIKSQHKQKSESHDANKQGHTTQIKSYNPHAGSPVAFCYAELTLFKCTRRTKSHDI